METKNKSNKRVKKDNSELLMNRKPLVSIIMNCLNGEEFLNFALESILNQTYKNCELIFWDNKSTDNSAKILKSFRDKRIRYFYAKKRTELHKARNLAIKKTRGEFIAFLDVDDIWSKEKLSLQIPKFKNKKIGLVYSNFYKLYEKNKKKIAHQNNLPRGKITNSIIKNYQIGIITVVIRKKFINKKNPFDFKYDLISDYDFGLDFSLKHNFESINKPLAYYRIHKNQIQKRKMILQAEQFCRWFKKKNIEKKFNNYDISSIKKKFEYYDLLKELNKSKIKLYYKMFKNFNFKNFLKLNALVLFPNKFIFKFIDNV